MVEWKRVEEVEYRERERERERERSYICAGTLYSFSPVQYLVDGRYKVPWYKQTSC